MPALLRHFAVACLLFAALGAPAAQARFSMPLADISPNLVGSPSMMAIWSSTDRYVTPSTQVSVIFPLDYVLPPGLNPATCQCLFLRHTSTSAGAWASTEVTFTAGTRIDSQLVSLTLPAALHPGKFYIRFHSTAGLVNPLTPGVGTLAIVDPAGNTTLSQGYYLRPSYTAAVSLGAVSGTVKDSNGKALPAALVLATNYDSFMPISIAARRQWVQPMSTSTNAYSVAVASDGTYAMSLPPGSYTFRAEVWRHKNGLAQSSISGPVTVVVGEGTTVPQSFSLSPLP